MVVFKLLRVGVAAVNVSKSDGTGAVGALKVTADMVVNFEERTATLYNRRLNQVWFPEINESEQEALARKIRSLAKNEPETMPLDTVLAFIAQGGTVKSRTAKITVITIRKHVGSILIPVI